MDQVDVVVPRPLQDRGQLDGRIGDADHQLRRAVDLGDEEPEAAGPDLLAAGGHLGAAQPDPDQRRVDRLLPAHHLQPYGLEEAVTVGRDQGLGDQSDGHPVGDPLSVHRVRDDLGPLERGVPDRAGREDGVGGHGRAFRWGCSVHPEIGSEAAGIALVSLPRVYATDRPAAGQVASLRDVEGEASAGAKAEEQHGDQSTADDHRRRRPCRCQPDDGLPGAGRPVDGVARARRPGACFRCRVGIPAERAGAEPAAGSAIRTGRGGDHQRGEPVLRAVPAGGRGGAGRDGPDPHDRQHRGQRGEGGAPGRGVHRPPGGGSAGGADRWAHATCCLAG